MRQDTGQDTNEHDFTLHNSPWHLDTGFDTALRGYHRDQVIRYVHQVETVMTEMATRQAVAQERIRELTEQIVALQAELLGYQRKQTLDELPPARYLGGRMEQILTAAEQQAEEIVAQAEQIRADAQQEAETALADATARAEETISRARRRTAELHEEYHRIQEDIKAVVDTVDRLVPDAAAAPVTSDGTVPTAVTVRRSKPVGTPVEESTPAGKGARTAPPNPRRPRDEDRQRDTARSAWQNSEEAELASAS